MRFVDRWGVPLATFALVGYVCYSEAPGVKREDLIPPKFWVPSRIEAPLHVAVDVHLRDPFVTGDRWTEVIVERAKQPAKAKGPKKKVVVLKTPGRGGKAETPEQVTEAIVAHLDIRGVLLCGDRKTVVVNEQTLTEGESLGEYKIVRIGRDSVEVRFKGKLTKLPAAPIPEGIRFVKAPPRPPSASVPRLIR